MLKSYINTLRMPQIISFIENIHLYPEHLQSSSILSYHLERRTEQHHDHIRTSFPKTPSCSQCRESKAVRATDSTVNLYHS